jgi:hypothetical protein
MWDIGRAGVEAGADDRWGTERMGGLSGWDGCAIGGGGGTERARA